MLSEHFRETSMRLGTAMTLAVSIGLASCGCVPDSFVYYPSVWDTPLHQAADGTSPTTLRAKISEVEDVDVRDRRGRTPLMLAARSGSPTNDNIRALIEAGAEVNARDANGLTPLMYAAQSDWHHQHGSMRPAEDTLERIRILVEAGADVNARADRGESVLMVAAGADRFAVLPKGAACTILIEKGAAVEARDVDGCTPLMYAARRSAANVPALLAAHADIDAADNQGRTALMIAFADEWGAGDAVEVLLNGHPNLEAVDQNGWTALAHAAWRGRTHHPADQIMDAGARLEPLGWTPLHAAALRRDSARLDVLLASHADPNSRDKWGRTPIMWAARYIDDDRRSIPALIRAGGDVNAADESGITALHIASSHAWDGEVFDLLANGALIDARDSGGQTPLMHAAASPWHGYQVEYLLKAGASVNAVDSQGRTALMHAVIPKGSRGESVPFLLKAHADKRIRDVSGRSAFDYAAAGLSERMRLEKRDLLEQLR
jgi:ankyrin repeat protein